MKHSSYRNWAMAAAGLLALTYGLKRGLSGWRSRRSLRAVAAAVPLALSGMAGWTRSLLREARR